MAQENEKNEAENIPLSQEEFAYADKLLSRLGESRKNLKDIAGAPAEAIRGLIGEDLALEPHNPKTPGRRSQITEEILRILDEDYDNRQK
ncbi:MAG: hypothetical protein ABSF55_03230 [Candidatus Staskawiczbacteria bacterium]|jgi:hypothetical protein